jgi:hypothetical protein
MKPARKLHAVTEDETLPYRRGESASEIAYRIRNGIRREGAVVRATAPPQPALVNGAAARLRPAGFDRAQ